MKTKGMKFIVSEYRVLNEALKSFHEKLESLSSSAACEDEELRYDEQLQDLEGIISALRVAAKADYNLDLT